MENILTNITGATGEWIITTRPCVLESVVVNKAAANGVITVYNNSVTGGTVAATITEPATLLQTHYALPYGAVCDKGLTVTVTGASNITVVHRPTMA